MQRPLTLLVFTFTWLPPGASMAQTPDGQSDSYCHIEFGWQSDNSIVFTVDTDLASDLAPDLTTNDLNTADFIHLADQALQNTARQSRGRVRARVFETAEQCSPEDWDTR